jgi:peptidoglycan/LPS O-acetylase OafA/YrhL
LAIRYRRDIDGLRAVAVVPIVLFHAGGSMLSGGFAGVDVFFTISGFLITAIVLREMDERRFSLGSFYRRRAVRILPALLAMLAVVLAAGIFTLLPTELALLGKSALAATAFSANIFFWRMTSYFGSSSENEILLHTWSLGVEEQFYILYPLLLILVRKFAPGRLLLVLTATGVLSFLLGMAFFLFPQPPAFGKISYELWDNAPFYTLPFRAWELALGGIVGVGGFPRIRWPSFAACVGAILIAVGYLVIEPGPAFPVPTGLLPCVGAALVIAYGESTVVGRLLSSASLRAIGRVSYSFYLWHWPVIVYYRMQTGFELDLPKAALLVGVSFGCAVLSYLLVERPLLRRYHDAPVRKVLPWAGAGIAAMAAVSIVVSAHAGRFRDLPPEVLRVASFDDYRQTGERRAQFRIGQCFTPDPVASEPYDFATCVPLSHDRPNVVLMGDSHAAQFWLALAKRNPQWNVGQATATDCRPLWHGDGPNRCRSIMTHVLGPMLQSGRTDAIILAGRWQPSDLAGLTETVARIRSFGVRAIVFGPVIEYNGEVPGLLARAMLRGRTGEMRARLVSDRREMDDRVRTAVDAAGGTFVDLQAIQCPGDNCVLLAPDGSPMEFDYGHVTEPAAEWIVGQLNLGPDGPTRSAPPPRKQARR